MQTRWLLGSKIPICGDLFSSTTPVILHTDLFVTNFPVVLLVSFQK
jgi:hypothetical protein